MRWRGRVFGAVLSGVFGALAIHARSEAQEITQFDLPAQPLGDSLRVIGIQTSTNVLFDPTIVQGQTAPAFKRRATLQEALYGVLAGSGLKYYFIDERTITLIRTNIAQSKAKRTNQR
jgi:hypothetical protein